MMKEHSLVVLDRDSAHEKLSRGDIGTIVNIYDGGKGYDVEFVDGSSHTVALITLDAADVRPIGPDELLHVRSTA
jgi:hypothetical protein